MKSKKFFGVIAALALAMLWTAPASAQASRTWISGVGDDANPCSRTAPCKTWAGAISKTAAGGEIDCLDPGGFGAVTITKAITLDCGGGIGGQAGSVLVAGTNGIVIAAGATDKVKIRNMSVNGLGQTASPGLSGIKFNSGAALVIEHVGIWGFTVAGVDFEPTTAGATLSMHDVETQFNPGSGILIQAASAGGANAVLDHVTSMSNGDSGLKVVATTGFDQVAMVESSISSNNFGIFTQAAAAGTPAVVNTTSTLIANNGSQGIHADGAGSTVRIGNCTITINFKGLNITNSASVKSFGDNYISGNINLDGVPTAPNLTKS